MAFTFLSKTKTDNDFLVEIINHLESEKELCDSSRDEDICISGIINDLKLKIDNKPLKPLSFVITEKEYNFLSQNEKPSWTDYLVFRYKYKIYPQIRRLTDFPTHILVELISYCNLRCRKCFQMDKTFTKTPHMGRIEIGLFRDIIDEAKAAGMKALTMASRGEPTLHPAFEKILEYVKGKFFDLKVNTNAMLLDEGKCHNILQNEVTDLVFSVDFTNQEEYSRVCENVDFDRIVNNIKRFHEIRKKEYPNSKCKTRVSGVKYSRSFDSKRFVEFWEQIVDNVACVDMVNHLWDGYGNKLVNKSIPCPLLWQRVYIWFDGIINPCDYDYKSLLKMGNAKESSIRDIWNGEQFERLRDDHLKGKRHCHIPCDRCERDEC